MIGDPALPAPIERRAGPALDAAQRIPRLAVDAIAGTAAHVAAAAPDAARVERKDPGGHGRQHAEGLVRPAHDRPAVGAAKDVREKEPLCVLPVSVMHVPGAPWTLSHRSSDLRRSRRRVVRASGILTHLLRSASSNVIWFARIDWPMDAREVRAARITVRHVSSCECIASDTTISPSLIVPAAHEEATRQV